MPMYQYTKYLETHGMIRIPSLCMGTARKMRSRSCRTTRSRAIPHIWNALMSAKKNQICRVPHFAHFVDVASSSCDAEGFSRGGVSSSFLWASITQIVGGEKSHTGSEPRCPSNGLVHSYKLPKFHVLRIQRPDWVPTFSIDYLMLYTLFTSLRPGLDPWGAQVANHLYHPSP